MWITEIGKFIATSSVKAALIVCFSSGLFIWPPDPWWTFLGLSKYHCDTAQEYGAQIFIAFIVSLVILLWAGIVRLYERLKNKGPKLQIIKATYGTTDDVFTCVTPKVKALIKKKSLNFTVDDNVLLRANKSDDPMPGSPKTLKIEVKYTRKYEKGDRVKKGHGSESREVRLTLFETL